MTTAQAERAKYEKAWAIDEYRRGSPGEQLVLHFLGTRRPLRGSRLTDFGCGTGRAAWYFHLFGLDVTLVDLTATALDEQVKKELEDRFVEACLWRPHGFSPTDYGYCCDVMEHIPPEHVDAVLHNIVASARDSLFHICFREDHFGKEVGEPLHLTVRPFLWWKQKLAEFGKVIEARDLLNNGLFRVLATHH